MFDFKVNSMSDTRHPADQNYDQPNHDDTLERSLRALRPIPTRLDESAVFYQAGFAAGKAASEAASRKGFRLTHLVAAASVSALVFGNAAYWFARNGARDTAARPLIAINQQNNETPGKARIMPMQDSDSATAPASADIHMIAESTVPSQAITPDQKQPAYTSFESPLSIPLGELWASWIESANRDFMTAPESTTLAVFHSSRWQWVSNDLPFALTGTTEPSARFSSGTSAENTPPAQAGSRLLSSQLIKEIL